eukprot:926525-Pelagomonas_calceolata.AAC.3
MPLYLHMDLQRQVQICYTGNSIYISVAFGASLLLCSALIDAHMMHTFVGQLPFASAVPPKDCLITLSCRSALRHFKGVGHISDPNQNIENYQN